MKAQKSCFTRETSRIGKRVGLPLAIALLAGCALSPKTLENNQDRAARARFTGTVEQVWPVAVRACGSGGLNIRSSDRAAGKIFCGIPAGFHTYGQSVMVEIEPLTSNTVAVAVVSMEQGLSVTSMRDFRKPILNYVGAELGQTVEIEWPPMRRAESPRGAR